MNGLEVAKYSVLSGVMMVRVVCSFPVAAMADCHELGGLCHEHTCFICLFPHSSASQNTEQSQFRVL